MGSIASWCTISSFLIMKTIPTFNKRLRIKSGQFGLVRYGNKAEWTYEQKPLFTEWYNCRDSFHYHWDKSFHKEFYYARPIEPIRNVIRQIEKRLNLVFKTSIQPTNWGNVTWIKPSRFWRNQAIRMSLFTILMRVVSHYQGNLDEAMDCDPYAKNTKEAIDYFLDGNCWYVGKENGWYQQFDSRLLKYYNKTHQQLLRPSCFLREIKLSFSS